jgi:hypothetical protein
MGKAEVVVEVEEASRRTSRRKISTLRQEIINFSAKVTENPCLDPATLLAVPKISIENRRKVKWDSYKRGSGIIN